MIANRDVSGIMIEARKETRRDAFSNMDQGKRKKKKSHAGGKLTVGAAAVLLLLAGGAYGIGGGKGLLVGNGDTVLPESTAVQATPVPAVPEQEEQDREDTEKILSIMVSENRILYNGAEVTTEELEERLLHDFDDSAELRVQDDHAIKAEYDEVLSLLERLGIRAVED